MYQDIDNEEIELGSEADTLMKAIESIKEDIKEKQQLQKKYENQLKDALGHNTAGKTAAYLATWKQQTRRNLDKKALEEKYGKEVIDQFYKESEYRVLRIKQIKEEQ